MRYSRLFNAIYIYTLLLLVLTHSLICARYAHACCAADVAAVQAHQCMLVMNPWRASVRLQDFYEDVFEEMAQYGEIENLNVCDNVADHMVGSVYIKFIDEGAAALALQGLQVHHVLSC